MLHFFYHVIKYSCNECKETKYDNTYNIYDYQRIMDDTKYTEDVSADGRALTYYNNFIFSIFHIYVGNFPIVPYITLCVN